MQTLNGMRVATTHFSDHTYKASTSMNYDSRDSRDVNYNLGSFIRLNTDVGVKLLPEVATNNST